MFKQIVEAIMKTEEAKTKYVKMLNECPDKITIEDVWNLIKEGPLHGVPEKQTESMKMVFYTGFHESFRLIVTIGAKLEHEEAEKAMAKMEDDIHKFFDGIGREIKGTGI